MASSLTAYLRARLPRSLLLATLSRFCLRCTLLHFDAELKKVCVDGFYSNARTATGSGSPGIGVGATVHENVQLKVVVEMYDDFRDCNLLARRFFSFLPWIGLCLKMDEP